jgi:hypothetical protein
MNARLIKFVVVILLVVVLAAAGSAFANTNTVAGSYAGDGFNTISGYNITGVTYTLSTTDPTQIGTVKFTLDHTASDVRVKLVDTATTYFTCGVSGTSVTCNITGVSVKNANQLTVIAVE